MNENSCSFESQIVTAAKTGNWPSELSTHVAQCNICEETKAVASFMNLAADRLGRQETAPDPTVLWLKAMLEKQSDDEKHASHTGFWARSLTGLAAAMIAWAAIQWIPPIVAPHVRVLAASSVTLVLVMTVAIVYFASYRPFKNAGS